MREDIKVTKAALAEDGDEIVLRGEIDPASLVHLMVDSYQREFLGGLKLKAAVAKGKRLTDVVLGMRGQNFESRGQSFSLKDPVYIVDGFQRVMTLLTWMKDNPGQMPPHLGAIIHFNTNRDWELEKFHVLNTTATRMSANVILRNAKEKHVSIAALYGLSKGNKLGTLYGRVCWEQRMKRGELFSALVLCNIANLINSSVVGAPRAPGSGTPGGGVGTPSVLDKLANTVGLQRFKNNVEKFFDVVDEVYGIKGVTYRELSIQTKRNFLMALAHVFALHSNFWRGGELHVSADLKAKLKTFQTQDPGVIKLSSSGNSALPLLVSLIVAHLNKGKRTGHLESKKKLLNRGNE